MPAGTDCGDLGFYAGGPVTCNAACAFDTSACSEKCGDSTVNGAEQCDGSIPAGIDCTDFGYYSTNAPTCSGGCTIDTSTCSGRCGDDLVNGPEICDGAPPSALACAQAGHDAGQLGCSSGCYDTFEHCRSFGFELEYPAITNGVLLDVWGTGNEFFAVGTSGTVVHTTGGAWIRMPDVGLRLAGVWGTSGSDVFAVGDALGGSPVTYGVFHYNGSSWQQMAAPTTSVVQLADVWGTSPTNVWAVGDSGRVLHYTGGAWVAETTPIPATTNLRGVWASGSTVVVVGTNGNIWRYNGSTWSNESVAATEQLTSVWGVSTTEIYAVTTTAVWRYTGTWSQMTPTGTPICPDTNIRTVGGMPGGPVFVVGDDSATFSEGRICQLAGGRWLAVDIGTQGTLAGIAGSDQRLYAVGNITALRSSGASWLTVPTIANPQNYNGVWGNAANNVYLVGQDATSAELVMRYDGTSWTQQVTPNGSFILLRVAGGTGWAVAVGNGGRIIASNGSGGAWSAQASSTTQQLFDVWGDTSGTNIFAVGANGTILARSSGTWSAQTSPTTQSLRAVWGSGTTVFAVGSNGAIVRKVGAGAFASMTSPTTQQLLDVWGRSPTDVYAVGNEGVFHFDGSDWSAIPSDRGYSHVWGAAGDVFVSTNALHFQIVGGRVLPVRLPITAFFTNDIGGTGDLTWFARAGNPDSVLALGGRMFRAAAAETVCDDFWDDDANGLADCADPACASNAACTQRAGNCQPFVLAPCGMSTPGTTIGGATRWPAYGPGCKAGRDEGSSEAFLIVRRATTGPINLSLSGFSGDLDLVVSSMTGNACTPDKSCLASAQTGSSPEATSFMATADTDYVVIVDGGSSQTSAFSLAVTCP